MMTVGDQRGGVIFRFLVLVAIVGLVAAIALGRIPIMEAAGGWLVVSDAPVHADAIIVLGGDDFQADRAAHAALLYRQGWAPVVVASGSQIRPYLSEAELTMRDLASDGVPDAAIIPFSQNDVYTLAEARDLRKFCIDRNWRSVLVVTSNFHTRRSRYIFRHVFPADIDVRVIAAPDAQFTPRQWWQTRLGTKIFFREAGALILAFWELHEGD